MSARDCPPRTPAHTCPPALLIAACPACRLAEHEEISGGKVRVIGLPRDRLHPGRVGGRAGLMQSTEGQEDWPDAGGAHDASFEQVLADLW